LNDYEREDDHLVEQALMRTLKRTAFRIWERRPIVTATVMRV
jgi:ribonuclease J